MPNIEIVEEARKKQANHQRHRDSSPTAARKAEHKSRSPTPAKRTRAHLTSDVCPGLSCLCCIVSGAQTFRRLTIFFFRPASFAT